MCIWICYAYICILSIKMLLFYVFLARLALRGGLPWGGGEALRAGRHVPRRRVARGLRPTAPALPAAPVAQRHGLQVGRWEIWRMWVKTRDLMIYWRSRDLWRFNEIYRKNIERGEDPPHGHMSRYNVSNCTGINAGESCEVRPSSKKKLTTLHRITMNHLFVEFIVEFIVFTSAFRKILEDPWNCRKKRDSPITDQCEDVNTDVRCQHSVKYQNYSITTSHLREKTVTATSVRWSVLLHLQGNPPPLCVHRATAQKQRRGTKSLSTFEYFWQFLKSGGCLIVCMFDSFHISHGQMKTLLWKAMTLLTSLGAASDASLLRFGGDTGKHRNDINDIQWLYHLTERLSWQERNIYEKMYKNVFWEILRSDHLRSSQIQCAFYDTPGLCGSGPHPRGLPAPWRSLRLHRGLRPGTYGVGDQIWDIWHRYE